MFFELRDYLRHILEEADFLIRESDGLTAADFYASPVAQRAFVRSLEVIGEATKKLPPEFTSQYSSIDWRKIAGMRDRLIHDYFGVDYEIVWDVVRTRIPELRAADSFRTRILTEGCSSRAGYCRRQAAGQSFTVPDV